MKRKLIKCSDAIFEMDHNDCDPSCWEIEDECVDWDALDEMMFGELKEEEEK